MSTFNSTDVVKEEFEIDYKMIYNHHFIEVDEQNRIIKGWSSAFAPATENSILINESGGYQFRLFPNGEENPSLFTMDAIPLYRWNGEQVIARDEYEITADRESIPKPVIKPTEQEQLRADVDFLFTMMDIDN